MGNVFKKDNQQILCLCVYRRNKNKVDETSTNKKARMIYFRKIEQENRRRNRNNC